jgi:hypothetical protein
MKQIEYNTTEAYEEMMQSLINISGHAHMLQGWYDSLFPIKEYLAQYDSTLLYRMSEVFGKLKILNRQIAKTFVKDDEKSIALMYEQIGVGISAMAKMTHENRVKFLEELETISEKYK